MRRFSYYPSHPHPAAGRPAPHIPGHSKGAPSAGTPGMEASMGEQLEGSVVAPTPTWCGGSGGPRMAHEAGNSMPVWLATRSRLITCYTGNAATGTRLLDLHRGFRRQASHTAQPPRGRQSSCCLSMCGC